MTNNVDIWLLCSCCNHSISSGMGSISVRNIYTAKFIVGSTCFVFSTRNRPNSDVSSIPAVSTIITGPNGNNSIPLDTGSVVVPAIGDTKEICCSVSVLIKVDLPALQRPKKPMCKRFPLVVSNTIDFLSIHFQYS